MALNLTSIMPQQSDPIDYAEVELDLLEFENELNNYCNALEIAETAQETQSAEVLQFAESLLGVSCEELVKGLGYEKDITITGMREAALKKFNETKETLNRLINDFGALKKQAIDNKVQLRKTVLFTMPNLGTTFMKQSGGKLPFTSGTSKMMIAEACNCGINFCVNVREFMNRMPVDSLMKSTKQKKHKEWRGYQYTISLGRRLLSTMRKNLSNIRNAMSSN